MPVSRIPLAIVSNGSCGARPCDYVPVTCATSTTGIATSTRAESQRAEEEESPRAASTTTRFPRATRVCFTLFPSLCSLCTRFIFPLRSLLASREGLRSVVPRRLLYDRSRRTRRSRRFSSKAAFPSDCTRLLLAVVNTRADRSMVFTHWIESRCPDRQVIFDGEER